MKRAIALALLLAAAPALAQQPVPDQAEANLMQQWKAYQESQARLGEAIDRVLAQSRQARAELMRLQLERANKELGQLREKCGDPCKSDKP